MDRRRKQPFQVAAEAIDASRGQGRLHKVVRAREHHKWDEAEGIEPRGGNGRLQPERQQRREESQVLGRFQEGRGCGRLVDEPELRVEVRHPKGELRVPDDE